MLKRNRGFVAKILFIFGAYYSVKFLVGQNPQKSEEFRYKLSESHDTDDDNQASDENQHSEHKLNPIVDEAAQPPVPELNKAFFDKIDHMYDGDVEIKKDEEHAAEPPPKEDPGKKFYEKFLDESDKDKAPDKIEDKVPDKIEEDKAAEEQKHAILPPKKPDGPGELGEPFKVDKEKVDEETKKRIDKGWQNNAYNEYVSDLISVHRYLYFL